MKKQKKYFVILLTGIYIMVVCGCGKAEEIQKPVYYDQNVIVQATDNMEKSKEYPNSAEVTAQNTEQIEEQKNYISDSEINIDKTPSAGRFCYSQMTASQKKCYEKIRKAVEQQRTQLDWNDSCCSITTIDTILMCITYDYPEYFWYSDEYCYAQSDGKNTKVANKIILKYEYTKDEVYELTERIYPVVQEYLRSVRHLKSDYEKALAGYEYIINNTVYDNFRANYGYGSFGEMDKETMSCWNISGVFLNHSAICRGYVQAYQYLMNLQGIKCGYVYGENHCWNIMQLDGDWYYTDVTWGDPVLEITHRDTGWVEYVQQGIDYSYFAMTTEQLLQIHTPDFGLNLQLPECTATKDNYFVRNPNTDKFNAFAFS